MIYPQSHSRQTVRSETIRPKISNWFSLMPKSVFVLLCLLGTESSGESRGCLQGRRGTGQETGCDWFVVFKTRERERRGREEGKQEARKEEGKETV